MMEGQRVAYAGDTDPFNEVGSLGKVIALSGLAAHVQWTSGPKQGSIDLVEQNELVTSTDPIQAQAHSSQSDLFDYSLGAEAALVSVPVSLQVRAVFEESGEDGVLNMLSEAGHLAMLDAYAEEAVGHLSARVRQDPNVSSILAQLAPDEAEMLVTKMASTLLTERLQEG